MLHQVGVSFDLYYDARKHKITIYHDDAWSNKHKTERMISKFRRPQPGILRPQLHGGVTVSKLKLFFKYGFDEIQTRQWIYNVHSS